MMLIIMTAVIGIKRKWVVYGYHDVNNVDHHDCCNRDHEEGCDDHGGSNGNHKYITMVVKVTMI